MLICKDCGKEFLSEGDPYVVLPKPSGVDYNCGCYFEKRVVDELYHKLMSCPTDAAWSGIYGILSHYKKKHEESE